MPKTAETLFESLNPEERLSLIHVLWDSLSDEDTPLSDTQRLELEERLARFEQDEAGAVTWESLRAELRAHTP